MPESAMLELPIRADNGSLADRPNNERDATSDIRPNPYNYRSGLRSSIAGCRSGS